MTLPHHLGRRLRFAINLLPALFPNVWHFAAMTVAAGEIVINQVNDREDTIAFTFTSTWPHGTSYQPEFLRVLDNAWVAIPDARIEPATAEGRFLVTAPKFGGTSGFYRVVNSVALPGDPIADTLKEHDPEEIILIWNQPNGGPTNSTVSGRLYHHVVGSPGGSISNSFLTSFPDTNSPAFNFGAQFPMDGSGAQDILLEDLTGDGRADPLCAWVDAAGYVTLAFASIAQSNFAWQASTSFRLTNLLVRPFDTVPPVVRLVSARVDEDPNPKVVLAYTGPDNFAHIALLSFGPDLGSVVVEAGIAEARLPFVSSGSLRDRSGRFDIAAGDFDGDGFDEIALLAAEAISVPGGQANWQLYVRFYNHDSNAARFIPDTIPPASTVLYAHNDSASRWLSRVAAHAADFDGDGRDELAAAYHVGYTSDTSRWFLQMLKPGADFASLTLDSGLREQADTSTGSSGYPLCLVSGEYDGDPEPELVYGGRQLFIYNVRTNLSLNRLGTGGLNTEAGSDDRRFLALAQLDDSDPNIGHRPEIVVVVDALINGNSQRRFTVKSYQVTGDAAAFLNINQDAVLQDEVGNNASRFFALGTADLGGNGTKLGTPRRYVRTVTGKPTVIVNAPPVHFERFAGTDFDVANLFPIGNCAGSGTCNFYSRYSGSTTQGITVETRWNRGWNFSAAVSGGFTVPIIGVGVEVDVQTRFSEQLDSYTAQSETTRVEVQVDAVGDDRIYAATVTYTIWEYPVLVDDKTVGHIVVIDPGVTRQNWFGSKSIVAQNYRQYHEVGNLLSYRPTTEPYAGADYVRNIISADTFTVDSSSSYIWRLTRTAGTTTSESRTFKFGVEAGADFDIPVPFIPDVELEGGYDTSQFDASTSTITDEQGLASFLGSLDGSIAGTAYSITPYVYWDRSGAVVLDYAVTLPAGTPGVPTFWGQRYSAKSDPAFILPWRLDPEKGDNLTDPSLRQLTREIMTLPIDPRPGEEVRLMARVSNFSLLGTPTTCKVRFYLGDPAANGTLITATDGRREVLTRAGIPAHGKDIVELPWRIPENSTEISFKIYAVIDADSQIDEIHEGNNVGWNEIFLRQTP